MYKLCVESEFSAAHHLLEYPGPCVRIHGHNWKVKATIGRDHLDSMGMVMDLMDLKKLLDECLLQFDHRMINEVSPFDEMNPTSENLARFIFQWLKKRLEKDIKMFQVEVFETDLYSVLYSEN